MSFETMSKDALEDVCRKFGAEPKGTKKQLIQNLEDEGVTYQNWKDMHERELAEKEQQDKHTKNTVDGPVPVNQNDGASTNQENVDSAADKFSEKEKDVLVKMDRKNQRYDIQGFTFTQEHPYVVMSESKAQDIFDAQDGFRLATPREAQEFYK